MKALSKRILLANETKAERITLQKGRLLVNKTGKIIRSFL